MGSKCNLEWNKRTLLIVTGASRGLGRCIAYRFAEKLNDRSCVILIARNQVNLEETKKQILDNSPQKFVIPQVLDLSQTDVQKCEQMLENLLEQISHEGMTFDQAILIHNAATLGDVSQLCASLTSASEIREYFEANLFSAMYLTSAFLSKFKEVPSRFIINITSLAAVKPIKGCSLYCTGKAARDMFFGVLAEEDESLTVLNYAPGPLLTDMLDNMLNDALPEVKALFYDEEGKLRALSCDFTVSKLISLLESSEFKSGDHVDVFDID